MKIKQLTEKHSLKNELIFRFKTLLLIGNRLLLNLLYPPKKFKTDCKLINEPVIAISESDLWNPNDNKDNWILTAGKIENIRIAAKKLNGLEINANEVFSFWQHIGNPNFGKGYAIGREIREGCIVPTIAGGLCQLSNALYDAALKSNFEIVERHKHTKVIKGSLAEQNRDATVKWNYIDLRFKSTFDFKIEIQLTSDKLFLSFKSKQTNVTPTENNFELRESNKLNDCYSCGNLTCFKHPDRTSVKQEIAKTTFILDEKWTEYDTYVKSIATGSDSFIVPLQKNYLIKTERYNWLAMKSGKIKSTTYQGIYRAIKLRFAPNNKNNVFELSLQLDKKIAVAATRKISIDTTHLVISQNLLPFIYETGILGGRTFDVLMTRLPIEKLHERLDFEYLKNPESKTLTDFRAPKKLIELENLALTKARKIITPHSEIAEIFKNKVEKLIWDIPNQTKIQIRGSKVLFPGSIVDRKGADEIKRLLKELEINLVVSGRIIENDTFWESSKIERFNDNFEQIGLIVYPTHIEHQPRRILKALSLGIPIITTTACGLESSELVKIVETNNFELFMSEVKKQLESNSRKNNQ